MRGCRNEALIRLNDMLLIPALLRFCSWEMDVVGFPRLLVYGVNKGGLVLRSTVDTASFTKHPDGDPSPHRVTTEQLGSM